jgi:pyruvate/2-oxoglutarate dehydrogenase complex dihydrolipoamide dehydrogenase (E3) component
MLDVRGAGEDSMRLLVIGGGPAGVAAALQGAELGADVTLVERGRVGGTSVNEGPAPIRTLARAARLARDARSWPTFGLRGEPPIVDLPAALANAARVADYSHDVKRMSDYIAGCGVTLVQGVGSVVFADPHTVEVADGRRYSGDALVVAAGGHAGRPPIPGAEHALTYEDVRDLTALPASVVIVGGSDTGCQLASILADFGVRVTMLEAADRLNPRADHDVSAGLTAEYQARGISVVTGTLVRSIAATPSASGGGYVVDHEHAGRAEQVEAEAVFFAVGWPGNADSLDPAAIGLRTSGGYVTVDDRLRSNLPHIFAAGDVNGLSMLVPSARQQGQTAAENAVLGTRRRWTHEIVPTGSFTDPEYGRVGLTEDEARRRYDCEVAIVRYDDLLRPVVDNRSGGFCKLIVESDRRYVLGAHVLGEYSAEVIQMVAACMAANMRVEQVAELPFAFPTFTEAVGMAAQKCVRQLGLARIAQQWSDLRPHSGG